MGRFGLDPSQRVALNAFVPLRTLQRSIDQRNRVNAIFVQRASGAEAAFSAFEDSLDDLVQLEDLGLEVVVPSFVISELRTAFQMGFVLYVPFLVIDMVVASVLMSMGMLMLPPVLISLPFKILLFVLVDGWHLVVRSLAGSFA